MPRSRDLAIFMPTMTDDNDRRRQTKTIALPLAHVHRVIKDKAVELIYYSQHVLYSEVSL